jgi:hypothetical protein
VARLLVEVADGVAGARGELGQRGLGALRLEAAAPVRLHRAAVLLLVLLLLVLLLLLLLLQELLLLRL